MNNQKSSAVKSTRRLHSTVRRLLAAIKGVIAATQNLSHAQQALDRLAERGNHVILDSDQPIGK